MHKGLTFITGSQFLGTYNNAIHCMEGYGKYLYPDGSQYKGNFKNGKFHGIGEMTLTKPYHFKFIGEFDNGKLVQMQEMYYADGLKLKAKFENDKLNFDEWKYCTEHDRRTSWEILNGIGPTGQQTIMTNLDAGTYDLGGGIYREDSGWVVKIPPPFFSIRFLSCNKEKEWVIRNCRRGPSHRDVQYPPVEPIPEIGKKIIETNSQELHVLHTCDCDTTLERQMDAENIWFGLEGVRALDSGASNSSSLCSFCDGVMKVNLEDRCRDEVETLKHDYQERKSRIYFSATKDFFPKKGFLEEYT
ncbi:uncharacterized protein LOC101454612 [Ceratitis capitata]|uniref:MORN repeat-containing protein 5 n=1 Tax=Ceratitis capitata TaxID=7213 RepID=W8CE72_CERCA|nr:uncharacterized protein LOC101454612 [Ceratitis capitata]